MSLQSHVHIALTLGGAPEFAPIYSWKLVRYDEEPEVILALKRTSSGKLRAHAIENVNGPIQFMGYGITIKISNDDPLVTRQYVGYLKAMNGRTVYFVDFDHAADGADHTADVKAMVLQISRVKPMSTMLNYYEIDVNLSDANTVV